MRLAVLPFRYLVSYDMRSRFLYVCLEMMYILVVIVLLTFFLLLLVDVRRTCQ